MVVFGGVPDSLIDELAQRDFETCKWNYGNDYKRYRDLIYWHIHEVQVYGPAATSSNLS